MKRDDGNGKPKSGEEAKSIPILRSSAVWRSPSPSKKEKREPILYGKLAFGVSKELERRIRAEAESVGVSISQWIKRLIERDLSRSEKR